MIDVKNVTASWMGKRAFYELPRMIYRGDDRWLPPPAWGGRDVLSARKNDLLRLPYAAFLAVEDGKPAARLLTGLRGGTGYFALFDAYNRPEAVRALLSRAAEWQRAMGASALEGPIAPVIADLGGGVLVEGFGEGAALNDAYNAPYYDALLRGCGMREESEWLSFRLVTARFDGARYEAAASRIRERFGVKVRKDLAGNPRRLAGVIHGVMGNGSDPEGVTRALGYLIGGLEESMCPVAFADGKPIAFLLTMRDPLKRMRPRVVTVWVDENWRKKGITALLFGEVFKSALQLNCPELDASQIKSDNIMSKNGVERAGGYVIRRYFRYRMEV